MAKPSFITSHKELLFTGIGARPLLGAALSILVDPNSIDVIDVLNVGKRS